MGVRRVHLGEDCSTGERSREGGEYSWGHWNDLFLVALLRLSTLLLRHWRSKPFLFSATLLSTPNLAGVQARGETPSPGLRKERKRERERACVQWRSTRAQGVGDSIPCAQTPCVQASKQARERERERDQFSNRASSALAVAPRQRRTVRARVQG